MSKLSLNKSESNSESINEFEVGQLKKSIFSLEEKIVENRDDYEKSMSELAEERNYDLWFQIGGGLLIILFLFKRTFSSFFIVLIFGAIYYGYRKYLRKENRVVEIKEDYEKRLNELELLLDKRKKELGDVNC